MNEVLSTISTLSTLLFAITSMLTVGLTYSVGEILAPLRDSRAVGRVILVNFVVVPAWAWLLVQLLDLVAPVAAGLLLLGTAAGAPFMIRLVGIARGDIGTAAGMLVLMVVATMIFMPIVAPRIVPGATIGAMQIATPLVLNLLLPLILGLAIHGRWPQPAERARAFTGAISSASLLLLIGSLMVLHLDSILSMMRWRTAIASVAFPLGALAAGYLMERRGVIEREVLAIGTSQRNIAAALVVSNQAIPDERVTLLIIWVALVTLALLFPVAHWMQQQAAPPLTPPEEPTGGIPV